MYKLILAGEGQLECNPEGFQCHDGHSTSGCADRQVVDWIRGAVFWTNEVDHGDRKYCGDEAEEQET